jgi:hypothetical protein
MRLRTSTRRIASAAALILALAAPSLSPARGQTAATEALTVNLAAPTVASTGVGEGFLYGFTSDGTQPVDQFIQPLGINAFRGGGWFSGGWIKDNYQLGSATQADINSILAQARRLTQPPYHAQYQVLLTDLYGLNGGQPSNTMYPCDNGNCSNWATFIDQTVAALQASGLKLAYDIDNEPDISVFWKAGVNSTQYFQMWDTAYREIRRVAPGAQIVGPSFAYTPQARLSQWQTWLAHVKAAGTVPDMITNHDEGDVDDPVTVSQSLNSALSAAGIGPLPLSANEYQPADRQTAGVTAWYLARFAQSGYTNAMRGNWVCCITPNLTGVLTQVNGTWQPTGSWWALREYADMTGVLVSTSGQVGSTAISASEDSVNKRVVAIVGDSNGYTGDASVTFNGLGSQPWMTGGTSNVDVEVDRIPDQAPLTAPQVVFDQKVGVTNGSVTVPFTFQSAHDAFAIRLTPAGPTTSQVTVTYPGAQTGTVGQAISGLQIQGSDSAGQTLTYSATGLPAGLSISSSGLITGTPTTAGTSTVVVSAMDTSGVSGSTTFTWTINGGTGGGFPSGYHRLVIANNSLCLDVYGNTSNAGAAIDQYTCNGQSNQQFQFVPIANGYGEIQAQNSGQDVTVANSSTAQGTPDIVQQPVNGSAASLWLPQQQSDGSWQFKNQNSGLCLDVYGNGSNTGQQLDQWPCKNAPGTNQDFNPR